MKKAKKTKKTHGGKRSGAGRPLDPNAKKAVPFRASPRLFQFLNEYENRTEAIEELLTETAIYKKWDKITK